MRRALATIAALAAAAPCAAAQVVAPPVAEYQEHAAGGAAAFDISNSGLRPLAVVLEPYSFWVDTLGEVHYAPFDTARVKLSLSAMSLRLPPRATYNVRYDARAARVPAWFVITATFAAPTKPGLNVRLQLPHVVYLAQKEPLVERDVAIDAFEFDSVARTVRFRISNASDRLGRCTRGSVRGAGSSQPLPDFPLFPHFVRWVSVPWTAARPPDRLEVDCADFTLRAVHPKIVAPALRAASRRASGD